MIFFSIVTRDRKWRNQRTTIYIYIHTSASAIQDVRGLAIERVPFRRCCQEATSRGSRLPGDERTAGAVSSPHERIVRLDVARPRDSSASRGVHESTTRLGGDIEKKVRERKREGEGARERKRGWDGRIDERQDYSGVQFSFVWFLSRRTAICQTSWIIPFHSIVIIFTERFIRGIWVIEENEQFSGRFFDFAREMLLLWG